jgi:hypothetical protein
VSIYNRRFSVSLPWMILVSTLALLAPLVYMSLAMTTKSFLEKEGPMWLFAVGLVPGLAVGLMQFLLSWAEFKQISKFSSMRIKGVLDSRDSEKYYADIIAQAQVKIDVQGVTASRFVSDFADETSNRDEKKLLIAALNRGVVVRILLPEAIYLSEADQTLKFPLTAGILGPLAQRFPDKLMVRYFDHAAIASIVRVDDDVLVGPIFRNLLSRNTPTIHTSTGTTLAQSYLDHFDHEWETARHL